MLTLLTIKFLYSGDEVRSGVKVVGSRLLKTPQAEKRPVAGSAWGEHSAAGDARVPRPALHLKVEGLECGHWQLALTPTCQRGNKKRVGGLRWSIYVCVCGISLIGLSQCVTSVPAGSQCVCDYHMSRLTDKALVSSDKLTAYSIIGTLTHTTRTCTHTHTRTHARTHARTHTNMPLTAHLQPYTGLNVQTHLHLFI